MNGYLTVFDNAANRGIGVVTFAKLKGLVRHRAGHGARMRSFGSTPAFGTNFCVRPY